MTETEKKALALVNEVRAEMPMLLSVMLCQVEHDPVFKALCRAIEQHEAFRQEVSDAVEADIKNYEGLAFPRLSRFIIAKPDPLVEALKDSCEYPPTDVWSGMMAERIRAALLDRGLKIVKDK